MGVPLCRLGGPISLRLVTSGVVRSYANSRDLCVISTFRRVYLPTTVRFQGGVVRRGRQYVPSLFLRRVSLQGLRKGDHDPLLPLKAVPPSISPISLCTRVVSIQSRKNRLRPGVPLPIPKGLVLGLHHHRA